MNSVKFTPEAVKALYLVIDSFDFVRVEEVMEFLNWHWCSINGRTPSADDIKENAIRLLMDAYDKFWTNVDNNGKSEAYQISSGGLEATYDHYFDDDMDDGEREHFHLKFVVTEAY